MNIAIIGTGARAAVYTEIYLSGLRENVHIKALCDINIEKLRFFCNQYFPTIDKPELYDDYNKLLEDENIDAVFICTPDFTHKDVAVAALKKNKHILLEKPIATTLEDSVEIYMESLKHEKVFHMGFVLRYSGVYGKIKEITAGGLLGDILAIEAKETLGYKHGGSFFRRGQRFTRNSGGFLNAKCSHDMDIINWIAGRDPVYISAFGSRSYFNNKESAADKCSNCKLINSCRYFITSVNPADPFSSQNICVFNSEKDIVDHQVVNIEYDNGLTASFMVSLLSAEANRTMVVFGTEATLRADFSKGTVEIKYIHPQNEVVYKFDSGDSSRHSCWDEAIYINFIDSVSMNDNTDPNGAKSGLMSSAIALAAEISMQDRKIVHLPSMLSTFGK